MLSLVVVSCRTSEDNFITPSIVNSESKLSAEDFAKITGTPQVSSDDLTKSFYNNKPFETFTDSNLSPEAKIPESTGDAVPIYTITVPVPSPSLTNQKIIYAGNSNGYPTPGVYYADIYNYYMKVQLPDDATGKVVSVETPGYSNYGSQTVGFNYSTTSENGKTYLVANTYTMVLKYNSIGQALNIVLPAVSGPKTFSYKYIIF